MASELVDSMALSRLRTLMEQALCEASSSAARLSVSTYLSPSDYADREGDMRDHSEYTFARIKEIRDETVAILTWLEERLD